MDLIETLVKRVENGSTYHIDLVKRTLRIDGRLVYFDYEALGKSRNLKDALSEIEQLYAIYKHSMPGERDTGRVWFKALKYDQLSHEDRDFAEHRYTARFRLELTVLLYILQNILHWDTEIMSDGWFWQSEKDKDLVILRSWIEQ